MANRQKHFADQGNIMMMFSKPKVAANPIGEIEAKKASVLTTTDPTVRLFYNTLTPYERIAHEIAVEKLGTSYDVRRTHGFLRWLKLQEK